MDDHVLFTGMLQGNALRAAYGRANAFALVSQKENFGHTAAEALSSGIDVVSHEVGLAPMAALQCRVSNRVQCGADHLRTHPGAGTKCCRRASDPDARSSRKKSSVTPRTKFSEAYESLIADIAGPDSHPDSEKTAGHNPDSRKE